MSALIMANALSEQGQFSWKVKEQFAGWLLNLNRCRYMVGEDLQLLVVQLRQFAAGIVRSQDELVTRYGHHCHLYPHGYSLNSSFTSDNFHDLLGKLLLETSRSGNADDDDTRDTVYRVTLRLLVVLDRFIDELAHSERSKIKTTSHTGMTLLKVFEQSVQEFDIDINKHECLACNKQLPPSAVHTMPCTRHWYCEPCLI